MDVDVLPLAEVTRLPDWHPVIDGARGYPVHGFVVHHPAGPVVVDTGVGTGDPTIDEWYAPVVTPLADCLRHVGVEPSDVVALINTHLHFDHCGQNHALPGVPTYVQATEMEAAQQPHYTVASWAEVPTDRLRAVGGDYEVLEGLRVLATPGHTPGHQSVVLDGPDGPAVIVGQAAWTRREYEAGVPVGDAFNPDWHGRAQASVDRLRSLRPVRLWFSHEAQPYDP